MILVLHCFSFVTIVLWFLCFSFLSLGFALHYIHAFHSRCFLFIYLIYIYIYIKERKERKRKHIIVLAVFSLFFENKVGQFMFTWHVLLYFVYLWWAYLLHFTSESFVEHVVWERCLWCLSLCLNLEVTCVWLLDLILLRKA